MTMPKSKPPRKARAAPQSMSRPISNQPIQLTNILLVAWQGGGPGTQVDLGILGYPHLKPANYGGVLADMIRIAARHLQVEIEDITDRMNEELRKPTANLKGVHVF